MAIDTQQLLYRIKENHEYNEAISALEQNQDTEKNHAILQGAFQGVTEKNIEDAIFSIQIKLVEPKDAEVEQLMFQLNALQEFQGIYTRYGKYQDRVLAALLEKVELKEGKEKSTQKPELDLDAAIARALQQQDTVAPVQSQQDLANDAAIATALLTQFEQTRGAPQQEAKHSAEAVKSEHVIAFKELNLVQNICKQIGGYAAQDSDIHQYSRPIGQLCRTQLFPLDTQYKITTEDNLADFESSVKEFLEYVPQEELGKIQPAIASMRAIGNGADNETQIPLQSLFRRCWKLAKLVNNKPNYIGELMRNLAHNQETQGGCNAGIGTRLAIYYSEALLQYMQDQYLNAEKSLVQTFRLF